MMNAAVSAALAAPLVESVKKLAREATSNRMPGVPEMAIFDEPLVRFADGDDPIFTEYKTIIDETHLTPTEALRAAFPDPEPPAKVTARRGGSLTTSAFFPPSHRAAKGPYDNCLYYADGSCGLCIERCPAGAISKEGHDKRKCQAYLHELGYDPAKLKNGYDLETSVSGCGLCQTKVPCEGCNPVK